MGSYLFNLLIFPLIGGYYIITRLEWYKYINQRKGNQDILFNAIIVGIPLLIISLAITSSITYFFQDKVSYLRDNIFPIKDHYFGTCILSFLLAVFGTRFLNLFINETDAIKSAIDRIGNELELLLSKSFTDNQLIQISLKNDKVYIGWIEVLPEPSLSPYIQIIPFLSGYRDDKKEMIITTNYSEVYSEYIKRGLIRDIDELDVNLVIQISDIVTASRFDFDVFEQFELKKQKPIETAPPASE